MKTIFHSTFVALALIAGIHQAAAQGTAFSYQGRLNTGGGPANGIYDLTFTLFNTNASGTLISGPITNSSVGVSNGLFTVAVDFGGAPFALGQRLWLEIGARTNGAASFSTLAPRQAVLSTPIATFAESANATNLTGTIVSANLPNGLGGSGNTASGPNSTVSGGGGNQVDGSSSYSTIGAGNANSISGTVDATIGGGYQNNINNVGGYGTIGGGNNNFIASTLDGTIAGGYHNMITNGATFAAVGGGNGNAIGGGFDSVIGGGFQNFVNASFATVPGGANNSATANYSFAAGDQAQATNAGAFVWADSQGVNFSSTNNNSFNVRAQGGARFVTSGAGLTVDGTVTATNFSGPLPVAQLTGTIVSANLPNGLGGSGNTASGPNSTVSGGGGNQVDGSSSYSTIGAGNANSISGTLYATIGGGNQNVMNNTAGFGTIGGGNGNFIANTLDGTIAGGFHNVITNGATFAAVGGGNGNAIGGGFDSVIGGGFQNFVNASFATVPGGANNSATANYSFAAGDQAQATNAGAFVWADSQGVNFSSTNNNSFNVRAQGGARFVTSGAGLTVDGPVTATSLTGNGSGLTALNGSQITSGTVADARLSANVPLLNTGNTYTGLNVYNNLIKVVGPVSNNGYFGFLEEDTSDTGDFWILTKWDNVGNKRFSIYDGNGVTPIVFQEHGGNVGIGTNQPGALLEVNGNAKIDGSVTAASFSASAVRAPGAGVNTGTFAFIQRAVGTNTTGNQTFIFNPVCDGDPNAILIVTHNWTADTNSTSQYNTKPVGVYFTGLNWAIFNEDTSAMALGRAFNVMVIKP